MFSIMHRTSPVLGHLLRVARRVSFGALQRSVRGVRRDVGEEGNALVQLLVIHSIACPKKRSVQLGPWLPRNFARWSALRVAPGASARARTVRPDAARRGEYSSEAGADAGLGYSPHRRAGQRCILPKMPSATERSHSSRRSSPRQVLCTPLIHPRRAMSRRRTVQGGGHSRVLT